MMRSGEQATAGLDVPPTYPRRPIESPRVVAIGGHVIKCGLQPVLKALIDAGVITAVAMKPVRTSVANIF